MSARHLSLDVVQRWFQAVITHPHGVAEGLETPAARRWIELSGASSDGAALESVIGRSSRLDSAGRLAIYADAYHARLIECLESSFPQTARALGSPLFAEFGIAYLQTHPSRSYTLNRLGDAFADWLRASRPERAADEPLGWPDLLAELAELEGAIDQVFDGPGVEPDASFGGAGAPVVLSAADLSSLDPQRLLEMQLETVPCLRLLAQRFPVNDYYAALRAAEDPDTVDVPEPSPSWLALSRRDWVVRRLPLSEPQYVLLAALRDGQTLGAALEQVGSMVDWDDNELAASLQRWFATWTALPCFLRPRFSGE